MITLSDSSTLIALDKACEACDSKGVVYNVRWQAWFDAGQVPDDEPDEPEELVCGECEGHGSVPTPAGIAILMLVQRYSEPTRR